MARRLPFLLISLLALVACGTDQPSTGDVVKSGLPPVILVSIDGFRPDYLHKGDTPALDRMAAQGVSAPMRPSFPSVTFPNHYTLVTGLRPDHHGIVGNVMHDADLPDKEFNVGKHAGLDDPRWWSGATPVWVNAQMHGLRTASMFWPGSDVPIQNIRPAEWHHYDPHATPAARVDTVLSWFDASSVNAPALSLLYFDQVDHAGHEFGPHSLQLKAAAQVVDAAMDQLLNGLAARHVEANIIVVSDHGMTEISPQRVVLLTQLAPSASMNAITTGSYAGIDPTPGHEQDLASALTKPHPHVKCWPKDRIPEHLHYGTNPRVPNFICLAEPGWTITRSMQDHLKHGAHGYDPSFSDMNATFIAQGPSFLNGKTLPIFDNVDIYTLVSTLLGLLPQSSDGSLTALQPGLHDMFRTFQ